MLVLMLVKQLILRLTVHKWCFVTLENIKMNSTKSGDPLFS